MSRVMQLCLILCCLVKLTLASLSCILETHIFKKLQFHGDIGNQSPGVCLMFHSGLKINIEVVCLRNNNTTVPISVFSTTTNITTKTALETTTQPTSGITTRPTSETTTRPTFETTTRPTSVTTTQPTSETIRQPTSRTTTESTSSITEQSTPSSTEQSSSSTAEVSQHERKPRRINYIVIGGAAGGGFLVVAIVVVVVVIMCRRRRLSVSQNKEQNINMSVNQTEEHTYNVENELYVSADDDILASGNHAYDVTHLQGFDVNHDKAKTTHDVTNNLTDSGSTYDQPDQYNPKNVEKMKRCSNEYSVVFKNKNSTPSVDDTDTYAHVNRI